MAVTAIHPGEHLAEELKELRMSAAELARKLDVPTNRITGIVNGQRAITGDTALRLAHFFGTSAEFWLNLQSLYDLRLAQKKAGKSIKVLPRLRRSEGFPAWMRYTGMVASGNLRSSRSVDAVVYPRKSS
jgi:addiction module HigA family antidote